MVENDASLNVTFSVDDVDVSDNPVYVKAGETIMATIESDDVSLNDVDVSFSDTNGNLFTPVNVVEDSDDIWIADFTISEDDENTEIKYYISYTDSTGVEYDASGDSNIFIDTIAPILDQLTTIGTTNDTSPSMDFSSNEAGTLTSTLNLSGSTDVIDGSNTLTFDSLSEGTYSDVTITVTDDAGNYTNLPITEFTIDTTPPTLEELTEIGITNDTSPSMDFSSDKAGTLTSTLNFSGSTDVIDGSNTVTFDNLSDDETYSDVTITVTDDAGNSTTLSITEFTIDTTDPTLSYVNISSDNTNTEEAIPDDKITLTFTASEEIETPDVSFKSGGEDIIHSVTVESDTSDNTWIAYYTVHSSDASGDVSFTIDFSDEAGNEGQQITSVTDNSIVTVDTELPTLNTVTISSDNSNNSYATLGNEITLSITSDSSLNDPTVVFYHSGTIVTNATTSYVNTADYTDWEISYYITSVDAQLGGLVTFSIDFDKRLNGLSGNKVVTVTDGTSVTVDIWNPYIQSTTFYTNNSNNSSIANIGDDLILTFELVDETEVTTPDVSFNINGTYYDADTVDVCSNVVDTTTNEHTASIYTYTATYTIDPSDNDGDVSYIIGDYTDAAGNTGTGITQYGTGVYVDKVQPEITEVTLTHNNTTNTPQYFIDGQVAILTIKANEAITEPTVVILSGGKTVDNDVTVTSTTGADLATSWKATYTVNGSEGKDKSGDISFTISNYCDSGGQEGDDVTEDDDVASGAKGFEVDVDGPTLDSVSLVSSNDDTTKATTNDTVTLTLVATKTINEPTVVFKSNGDDITDSISYTNTSDYVWEVSYSVNSNDTSGVVTFTIDYTDLAGNSGEQVTSVNTSTSVTVDNIAPTLSQISISSNNQYDTTKATSGNTVTLTFTASETINEPTVVFTSGGNAITNSDAISYSNTTGNTWTAQYTVHSNDSNHKVSYTITVSDPTGNTTTETMDSNANSVIVDLTAPTIDTSTTNLLMIVAPENNSDNYYNANNTIIIGVTFDKNVQIKSGSTSPSIVLNSGGTASYKENLDNIIYFSYTVGAGENSSPLNIASLLPFNNGASIIDSIGNEADLKLSSAKTVLKNENITIDTTAPNVPTEWTITSTRSGSESDKYFQYAKEGHTVTVSLTFDEKVTISSASFTSNNISVTNAAYGSNWSTSSRSHTVSYDVYSGDTEGVVGFSITYADEAGNTTTIDENAAYQTNDSTTTFETITIDLTAATLTETFFGEKTGKTEVTFNDVIRLEFTSSESVAFSAYGVGAPTVEFYGLNSGGEYIDTVSATQVTDGFNNATPNNSTTWAYEGTVPDTDDNSITSIAYKITAAYDKAGNKSTLIGTDFIEVDEVAPTIVSSSIISNNSLNTTSYAKSGDIVTLTINPDETINQPTVYFKVGNTATANNSITTSTVYSELSNDDTWTATYTINDNYDGDGVLYYTIASYTDIAGNSGDIFYSSGTINVLTSTPRRSVVSIVSNNANTSSNTSSKVKDGDTVTVYFNGTRTLNSATVKFLKHSESVTATTSSYSTYDWEASYTVSGSDSDGDITFTINFEDLAGNPGSTSSTTDGTSVTIDNTAPTINAITTDAFSWGAYLNIDDSNSSGTVRVTTSDADDQQLTLTLNGEKYNGTVSETSNTYLVTISQEGLSALTDGSIYYISADVTDLVGNAATTVNSSFFTVDTTTPTIINVKGISKANSYKAGDTITISIEFSETVYVTGSPSLNLNSGTDATATYDSGSESTLLLFKYTVSSGDSTISDNTLGYLDVDVDYITYDSENYIKDVAKNETDYSLATGGTENSLSYNTEIVIDTTAPSDFQVGTVQAKGGIYDAGFYNSNNTSVNIHVPIDDDQSLIDGTIRLIYSTNNESTFDETSFSSYDYTIVSANLGNVYTFSINEVDFETNIQEAAEIHFSAIITDKAGNQTTGTTSEDTIIRDDIAPIPVTVGDIIALEGRVADNYYNSTNNGLTISVPINNNPLLVRPDDATTIIAGTIQVLVSVDNGASYTEIGDLVEIESSDLLTTKKIEVTDEEFVCAVAEGETALFNVTITDKADNITSSSPAPTGVTVSPEPDYNTLYDPYANSPSNGFIRLETLPPVPNVSFTTGSTKTNYNNRIRVKLDSSIVKWEYSINFGNSYSTIYNNNGGFISLTNAIYLAGSIIIRNYDIADNRSFVSNTNKIIIASARQGYPLANQTSNGVLNKTKGIAFSRGASST